MSNATQEVQYENRKGWELALGACAATVPTLITVLMMYASYVATGVYGATTVLAGTIISGSRILDGITDPLLAVFSDRFMTKFGRARPLVLLGYLITSLACLLMYVLCPGEGNVLIFVLLYVLYILGYTIYGIGNNMIQPIMTNNPKQRPIFTRWSTTYTTIISNSVSIVFASFLMPMFDYQVGRPLFRALCFLVLGVSGIFVILSLIAVTHAGVDVEETYVGKKKDPVRFRDMFQLIKDNRAMQMYIVAAASDKLAMQTQSQSSIRIMVFGIVMGSYSFVSDISMANMIISLVMVNLLAARLAGNRGMKKALVTWTWASLAALVVMFTFMCAVDTQQITANAVLKIVFIILYCLMGATKMSTTCVTTPCLSDIVDYEFYRSGRYMPGIVSATYSFVDKLISSLASTVVAFVVALIGYTSVMPQTTDPYTAPVFWAAMFLWLGMPALGYICTLIAMKWYPLDQQTMIEVQRANAATREAIKAGAAQ